VGANQFTVVGLPITALLLPPIMVHHTTIMGPGTTTARDGATIVPGDGKASPRGMKPALAVFRERRGHTCV